MRPCLRVRSLVLALAAGGFLAACPGADPAGPDAGAAAADASAAADAAAPLPDASAVPPDAAALPGPDAALVGPDATYFDAGPTGCALVDCPAQCVIYVDPSAATPGDGKSPATAVAGVKRGLALASAAAGECCTCEVKVATGTYYVYEASPLDTVALRERVSLLGGFPAGFGGASSPLVNPTILDGRRALPAGGPDDTARVFHVVTGAEGALLDGFTVQEGAATEDADDFNPSNYGGGLYAAGVSMTASHCAFKSNRAVHGGGAFVNGPAARFENCRFEANEATEQGGGLDVRLGGAEVLDSRIAGNKAADGAGLHAGPRATVSVAGDGAGSCLVDGNTATGNGGGIASDAAAVTLVGCVVSGNFAVEGGGVSVRGGGSVEAQLTQIKGNTANLGGGLLSREASTLSLVGDASEGCLVAQNVAHDHGGGVAAVTGTASLTRCTVKANAVDAESQWGSQTYGAGLYFEDAQASLEAVAVVDNEFTQEPLCISDGCMDHRGGGLYALRSTLSISGGKFENNESAEQGIAALHETTATVAGTRFASNRLPAACANYPCEIFALYGAGGSLTVTDTAIVGNQTGGLLSRDGTLTASRISIVGNPTSIIGVASAPLQVSSPAEIDDALVLGNVAPGRPVVWIPGDVAVHLTNCTIVGNTGMSVVGGDCSADAPTGAGLTLTNSIVWGNSVQDGVLRGYNCPPQVTYCAVQGGFTGAGNISVDPLFANTSAASPKDWDVHLKASPTSPCIDTGTSTGVTATKDLDGLPRAAGTSIDMGAYENQGN